MFANATMELGEKTELDVAIRYDEDKRENTTETPEAFLPLGTPPGSSGQVREAHLERAAAQDHAALRSPPTR